MIWPYSHEINASASESGYTIKSHYYSRPNEERVIKVMDTFYYTIRSYTIVTIHNTLRVAALFICFIVSLNVIWQQKDPLLMIMMKLL